MMRKPFGATVKGHYARKSLGQNFLHDERVISQIVTAVAKESCGHLVEIGPGLGALTYPLLALRGSMTVIELDRDLVARLEGTPGLTVVGASVLDVNFSTFLPQPLRIVGNLPYHLSSPILFHLFSFAAFIFDQHFMLQKEVVDRMVAQPSTAAYGRLSVMLQWRYAMESLFTVNASSFRPVPKVASAVVRMLPHAEPVALNPDTLSQVVRVAFSQRRKLLRHTLEPWLEQQGFTGEFDVRRRAEEVSVQEYLGLVQALERQKLETFPA